MILGFLGKGGSGKSSVSSQIALFLNSKGKNVLAIDADHNMDLSFNLNGGEPEGIKYFSESLSDLKDSIGLKDGEKSSDAIISGTDIRFSLTPLSEVIKKYSKKLNGGIRLMTAGPQTEDVLHDKACSHILTTPLKALLPLMSLKDDEFVVVDEKAGADGVSTGIVTGIDVGVIVCEPSLHSVKTANQISELMDFYKTPYIFVGNKIESKEDEEYINSNLRNSPTCFLPASASLKRDPAIYESQWEDNLESILENVLNISHDDRLERTIEKFKKNRDFKKM